MNIETIIRVPLNEQQYQSLSYYVNQKSSEEYIVKRIDALTNFSAFLDENEKKVIEGEKGVNEDGSFDDNATPLDVKRINYVVFYKLI